MDDLAIGIDLGTTNSCVSLYMNGKTQILENSNGGRITPSFICFLSVQETLIGEHAKRMADTKPSHGVYEVKRLVGRTFGDSYIQNNLKYLPFTVDADDANNPVVRIKHKKKIFKKTPQELCAIILQELKRDAESKLGQVINKVVITVPAYFNVTQREVTLAAAKDAGFTVLKLLNEPTAAALFYFFENDNPETTYSLVYDLGGGTFDVAILQKSLNNIEIICVDGDTELGGHDFDNLIMNYVCEKILEDYNYDPRSDKDNLRRLHNKCEDAKRALSSVEETPIVLIGFVPKHLRVQILLTRHKFEEIAHELFQTTIDIVDGCVKASGISKSSIQEIILSGGSTRIPKIQKMLSSYFDGKRLNKFVNPDECVAEGAALQAAMLSQDPKQSIQKIKLTDVIPLSLGIADFVDEMSFLIKRNSVIPASGTSAFVTTENRQSGMTFKIFEGERANVKENRFLNELTISNITPAPPGQCKATVTMTVDENCILTITAKETYRNNIKELKINYTKGIKSAKEIKNALTNAEKNKEDQSFKQFAKVKGYLLGYCTKVMYNLDNKKITPIHRSIYELCKETKASGKNMKVEEKDAIKQMIEEIKAQCEPLVKYYNFEHMPPPSLNI